MKRTAVPENYGENQMHLQKTFLLLTVLFLAGCLSGQEIKFDTKEAWTGVSERNITLRNGVFKVQGRVTLVSRDSFDIQPGKTYTLKGSFKSAGAEGAKLYFGFRQFDKNGRDIQTLNTDTIAWTDTVLIKPAKAADKTLFVKNAMKWKKYSTCVIAYHTSTNFQDLPNFNILENYAKSTKKIDTDEWEITLSKSVGIDLPAGTNIRQHGGKGAGEMYTGGYLTTSNQWQTLTGSASGKLQKGFSFQQWAPGAVKAKVCIRMNWNNSKAATEMKNITLVIK